jgi:hypothetical protein
MGDYGAAAAAVTYAASNVFSWAQALLVPGAQAAANILLMEKQKSDYDSIVNQQRNLLDAAVSQYISGIDALIPLFDQAYPDVPQAAEYVPIDACCIQRATIECNIATMPRADVYAASLSRYHEQSAIVRAIVFDPRFLVNMDLASVQISDLLRGRSSVGDVVEVMTDNAELAALTGRIGATRRTTARDLGLSKMRAQAAGREELRTHHGFISRDVSPLSRLGDIRDMVQTPAQRIALALTQAQLIQNSLQNLYNQQAQKDPRLLAELQTKIQKVITKLQFQANKATLVNTFVPNYAAILEPMVKSVAQAIGDPIGSASGVGFYGEPGQQVGYNQPGIIGTRSASERPGIHYAK